MEILASGHPDHRLTIRIGENFYTCINSQMIPPTFDNFDILKSNCEGVVIEYDKNGYLIDNKVVLKPTLATKEYSLKGFTQKEQKNN